MSALLSRLQRGLKKPPRVIVRRLWMEMRRSLERVLPTKMKGISLRTLLHETGDADLDALWSRLARRPFPLASVADLKKIDELCPEETERVLQQAVRAACHEVDFLGSGPVVLGETIDWHRDYKSEYDWPVHYAADLDYVNRGRRSDVKFPWELSRLQWLISVGQAYRLTGDNHWAIVIREVLNQWIDKNPCGYGVNWACTMEAALRIFTWTWLFHACHDSAAWSEPAFRERFLTTLYQHVRFTDHYLEYSDVNGNHCTADAAALVWGGLFFGEGAGPKHWLEEGWRILTEELPRQVTPDGVNFEGSIPYHRLVTELFFLSARYRELNGFETPDQYRDLVIAMARYTQACIGPDGRVPVWGDADDGRIIPCGDQHLNDHRYLPTLIGAAWNKPELREKPPESLNEIYWLLGMTAAQRVDGSDSRTLPHSTSFQDGGYYILQNNADHVFIDCAPVGLAGRGGHGHNDTLAFEAVLDGCRLIVDRGPFAYTLDLDARNEFRGTRSHNTPSVNKLEINSIPANDPWTLRYEAVPKVTGWELCGDSDLFQGEHAGYQKLHPAVVPVRTIQLQHNQHLLTVRDDFRGDTGVGYSLETSWYLDPQVSIKSVDEGQIILEKSGRWFTLEWSSAKDWNLKVEETTVSPSYGLLVPSRRLVWRREGTLSSLSVRIHPSDLRIPEEHSEDHQAALFSSQKIGGRA